MGIIMKPVVTEKMTEMGEKLNRFAFVVDKGANKIEIKKAVEDYYDVTVLSVNTMIHKGKAKSRNTKAGLLSGRTNAYKKAVVTLAEGDTIDFFANI
jgi:large subunit ribosomal protein L23